MVRLGFLYLVRKLKVQTKTVNFIFNVYPKRVKVDWLQNGDCFAIGVQRVSRLRRCDLNREIMFGVGLSLGLVSGQEFTPFPIMFLCGEIMQYAMYGVQKLLGWMAHRCSCLISVRAV